MFPPSFPGLRDWVLSAFVFLHQQVHLYVLYMFNYKISITFQIKFNCIIYFYKLNCLWYLLFIYFLTHCRNKNFIDSYLCFWQKISSSFLFIFLMKYINLCILPIKIEFFWFVLYFLTSLFLNDIIEKSFLFSIKKRLFLFPKERCVLFIFFSFIYRYIMYFYIKKLQHFCCSEKFLFTYKY